MNDCYSYEINNRNKIMDKIHQGVPITKQERTWLVTHSLFNRVLGFPYFNVCIEKIKPKTLYNVLVKIDNINYNNRITPVFGVPNNKGYIYFNDNIEDIDGNVFFPKRVKILGFNKIDKQTKLSFEYYSDLGLISVYYECNYLDTLVNLSKKECSSTGNPNFAITRNQISDNKITFSCKNPQVNSFDALVFTLTFEEQNKTTT